jgi:hypothetical protein
MRDELLKLIEDSFVYKYNLPGGPKSVARTVISTIDDNCYSAKSSDEIKQIIYNAVIEYSCSQFEMEGKDLATLHTIALQSNLRYDEAAEEEQKLKYGFYGEVLLYCFLYSKFRAKPLISRGYFYNPLEKSETKGYDSYHLIQTDTETELWFGEVKFHGSYKTAITSVLDNLKKAISDDYLKQNVLALRKFKDKFEVKGTKMEAVIKSWEAQPTIKIADEVKKHNMKLVYPVLLAYDSKKSDYDTAIAEAVAYLKDKYEAEKFDITIDYTIFFIFFPLEKVNEIKKEVIQWIGSKKALIS